MSRDEIKSAINELLDKTSEDVLNEILLYLKSVEQKSEHTIATAHNLRRILTEDSELLQKLAE